MNYVSQQSMINKPDGIDFDILKLYEILWIEKGFKPIPTDDLKNTIKTGCFIKYITDVSGDIKFASGGAVTVVENDYFVYKCFNLTFSAQFSNIKACWIKIKQNKKNKNKIIFKSPDLSSKFISYIDDIPVASHKDNYAKKKFESSKKFLKALETKHFEVLQ